MVNLGEHGQPVHVYLVNLPIQDPWRTQGDYLDDARRAKALYRVAVASIVIAAFSGTVAAVSAVAALRPSTPHTIRVECPSASPAPAPQK